MNIDRRKVLCSEQHFSYREKYYFLPLTGNHVHGHHRQQQQQQNQGKQGKIRCHDIQTRGNVLLHTIVLGILFFYVDHHASTTLVFADYPPIHHRHNYPILITRKGSHFFLSFPRGGAAVGGGGSSSGSNRSSSSLSSSSSSQPWLGISSRSSTLPTKPLISKSYPSSRSFPTTLSKSQQSSFYTVQEEDETNQNDEQQQQWLSIPSDYNTSNQQVKEQIQAFLTRDHRNSFITRVYMLLSGQLLFTAAVVIAFSSFQSFQRWILMRGKFVPMLSVILSSIAWFITCLSPNARRSSPTKWYLFALFTLGEATAVGFLSSFYRISTVVSALFSTALATVGITCYTLWNSNPKYDLSQWGSAISSIGMIFIAYGVIHLLSIFGILPHNFLPYNERIISFLGATLYSVYLAYHTRLVVGGKHSKYQMNEQDYVFEAMTLYSDIVNLFLYLLRLLEGDHSDEEDH